MGFQVDTVLPAGIVPAREAAKHFEKLGYHGLYTAETTNDPLMDLAAPALETTTPMLSNNLVIAFARSPYSVASLGMEPSAGVEGTLRARSRHPGEGTHHASLRHDVGLARPPLP